MSQIIVDKVEVEVVGNLNVNENQCTLQMSVKDAVLNAQNSLMNYAETIRKLKERELWPKRPKHLLPELIQRIGLITFQGSKALVDYHTACEREGSEAAIENAFAPVQGTDAAAKIAANINRFSQSRSAYIIVVMLGSGHEKDLSEVFDDYLVAEAICQSVIPVMTAIGHFSDQTLADVVADDCDITPTGAAVRLAKIPAKRSKLFGLLKQ